MTRPSEASYILIIIYLNKALSPKEANSSVQQQSVKTWGYELFLQRNKTIQQKLWSHIKMSCCQCFSLILERVQVVTDEQ